MELFSKIINLNGFQPLTISAKKLHHRYLTLFLNTPLYLRIHGRLSTILKISNKSIYITAKV